MEDKFKNMDNAVDRRSFLKKGVTTAGAAAMGTALLSASPLAFADQRPEEHGSRLSRGDAALLRFAAAAEILETDFWVQYNELGGIPDSEVPGGSGNSAYTTALSQLDSDMAQTCTTTPMTSSLTRISSTRISLPKERAK
jgi:hypothetical protein